jgi:hypothetical protein
MLMLDGMMLEKETQPCSNIVGESRRLLLRSPPGSRFRLRSVAISSTRLEPFELRRVKATIKTGASVGARELLRAC